MLSFHRDCLRVCLPLGVCVFLSDGQVVFCGCCCLVWFACLTVLKLRAKMWAQGIQANITYNDAIRACEKSKDQWQTALKLLAEMRAQDIQPNVITYSATISACEKSKDQWQSGLKLLAEMQAQGIQPDVISSTAAIGACEKPEVHGQEAVHVGTVEPIDQTIVSAYVARKSKHGRNKIRFQ